MKQIIKFLSAIWYFRRNRKKDKAHDDIMSKLDLAIKKKRKEQKQLLKELNTYARRFLKLDARSRFIPLDNKSNTIIRKNIEHIYGNRMKALDIILTDDMQIKVK